MQNTFSDLAGRIGQNTKSQAISTFVANVLGKAYIQHAFSFFPFPMSIQLLAKLVKFKNTNFTVTKMFQTKFKVRLPPSKKIVLFA